jgi:hypothetical protein
MRQPSPPSPFPFFQGILIPLVLWLGFIPWSAWLDLKMSHLFYEDGAFMSHPFWDWLYNYGIWPAWLITFIAMIGLTLSFFQSYRAWRKPCVFLLLSLAIGSGLIIHAGLKDHWGRPRPRQITEFGGEQSFRSF